MPKPPNFFSKGPKVFQNLEQIFFQRCHEAHEIDQRNALNAKMYVGGPTVTFFQGSEVVTIGKNWPAKFVIVISSLAVGGGGGAHTISIPDFRSYSGG